MEFSLNTDFSKLDSQSANKFMTAFTDIADDAFCDRDEKCRLLADMLLMSRFLNAVRLAMETQGAELSPGITKAYNILWDHLEGKTQPVEFEEFANNLNGFYSNCAVGTDFDVPEEFYAEYVPNAAELTALELCLFEWCDFLLLALVSKAGWHIPHFEDNCPEDIDFGGLSEMLDLISDMCLELCDINVPSSRAGDLLKAEEQLYKTPLYTGFIAVLQNDLKTALNAAPADYRGLREKYRTLSALPDEYAARLPLDY